jgi:hypothetical protein
MPRKIVHSTRMSGLRATTRQPRGSSEPSPYRTSVRFTQRFRFYANAAATNTQVTCTGLLDMLCTASSGTVAYQLLTAFRLKSVEMWDISATTGATVVCEFPFASGTVGGPETKRSVTSLGNSKPAYLRMVPVKGSLQSMWQSVSSTTAFILLSASTTNSVVDIVLECVMQNGQTPVAVSAGVAGATVGTIYLRALDNQGSQIFAPAPNTWPTI